MDGGSVIIPDLASAGWCVVISESGRQELAERSIEALGYSIDFIWYRGIVERRIVTTGGKRCRAPLSDCIVRRSLFGRYGFVLVPHEADAVDIDEALGVSRLLRHAPQLGDRAGRPKRVRASLVEGWRARNAAHEFDDPRLLPKPALRDDLKPGSKVRMPWRDDGLTATVLQMDEAGRAQYLIDLLGGVKSWFTREETAALEMA